MARNDSDKKASKFNPFSWMMKDGIGVDPDEPPILDNPGIVNYFKLFGRKLSQIISVNLMMLLTAAPLVFLLAVMTGYFSIESSAPAYSVFSQINAAFNASPNAATSALIGHFGVQSEVTVFSTVDYVFLGISAFFIFTFGFLMVGATYIHRNMIREEHIFLWQDFWYAVKRNIKQGIIFGIIDLVIVATLVYNLVFYYLNYSMGIVMMMLFFATLFMALLYFFMRMYIYIMMITFDLSIGKLLKNALIFSVLGIKRNFVCLLLVAAFCIADFLLLSVYFPLGIIVPFVIGPSFIVYTTTYYAYPIISKYMIEPYYGKNPDLSAVAADELADSEVESEE